MTEIHRNQTCEKLAIEAILYHISLTKCLKSHEDGLWEWFASDEIEESADNDARLYLLKNAVRLDRETHSDIYNLADEVAEILGIENKIVLYQGDNNGQRNAMLIAMKSEVAIFFGANITEFLSPEELRALLAHEMAHFLFKSLNKGDLFIADRLLTWVCNEGGENAHKRSLWLSQLYQEIFADRVALHVCKDIEAPLSLLVKIGAGISNISSRAYLEQAEEAMALSLKDEAYEGAGQNTHPELFIRALAMRDWLEDNQSAPEKLKQLIEGNPNVHNLDLLQQSYLSDITRGLIEHLLKPQFSGVEALEIHAREYFPDFDINEKKRDFKLNYPRDEPGTLNPVPDLCEAISTLSRSAKSYMGYVMSDFAFCDPNQDDLVLIEVIRLSEKFGMKDEFDEIAIKDLTIEKAKLEKIRKTIAKQLNVSRPEIDEKASK
ncbi:MAG: M48 family metalloprotease [Hyphomicrobiales bacterium]|nr:M48 family metalloprotease [Hyphomicrobiales bacterium]